ncbi:DUF4167 domain-containing protein [Roseomonas elaeocarpi]|uniref:DUF4167 domain-containing protein n=1 Tax=Roseomonas elaeocarpi TaxID=907779 RepID=A0ABV6JRC7_9PROT
MNMKRMRGRGGHRHNGGGGQGGGGGNFRSNNQQPMNRNHVFDSSGPDMRMRGTAQQLFEKYLQLGRDATGSGDRVMAESYFQHAEHYFRILNAMAQAQQNQGPANPNGQNHQGQGNRRWQNGPDNNDGQAPQDSEEINLSVHANNGHSGNGHNGNGQSGADSEDAFDGDPRHSVQ